MLGGVLLFFSAELFGCVFFFAFSLLFGACFVPFWVWVLGGVLLFFLLCFLGVFFFLFFPFFMNAILSFFDFLVIFLGAFFFSFHFCFDLPQVSVC